MSETAHTAASRSDARLADWIPTLGSADSDWLPEAETVTARSRDLARNHALASGVLQTNRDNIIGHQLRLSSKPDYKYLGWEYDEANAWGNAVEAQFRSWGDTRECDAGQSMNLLGLAHQALTGAMMNGDGLALLLWAPRNGANWSTRVQMIESDRLETPPQFNNNPKYRGGVEIDEYGAPVAYHIRKQHPGDSLLGYALDQHEYERIPAFTPWGRPLVIHLHDKDRSGQSRGKPIFTAVLREFRVAGEYIGSELQAAAVNALIAAFLESDLPPDAVAELFGSDPSDAGSYWKQVSERTHRKKLEGGSIFNLPIGTKLSSFDPSRPNVAFGDFMEAVLRHISAGLNIPYELLAKDFSKTNYSSARAALLEAWRYFLGRRRWLKDYFLQPIYEAWMEEAVNTGRVVAPDFYAKRYGYTRCKFVFAGRGWVDPVKESKAAELRMNIGISTLEDECAEQGNDWEEVMKQRLREEKAERELREEMGLPIVTNLTNNDVVEEPGQPDEEDEDEEEDDKKNRD
ncbi:MAG: phage portal protein [Dechloromonas sp.]|nr:phage portal protein [Dechloromonas sp.]